MKLVNCTPHPVTIIKENGSIEIFAPLGFAPRIKYNEKIVSYIGDVPIFKIEFDSIDWDGLMVLEGETYIVSSLLKEEANKIYGEGKFVSPYNPVRNDEGQIIGCRGFS